VARHVETIETSTDDLDGSKAEESVVFAYAGATYELDLSKKNAKTLHSELGRWATAGRKVKAPAPSRHRNGVKSSGDGVSSQVRAWAAEHGIDVPARGRISAAVREQWEQATTR